METVAYLALRSDFTRPSISVRLRLSNTALALCCLTKADSIAACCCNSMIAESTENEDTEEVNE